MRRLAERGESLDGGDGHFWVVRLRLQLRSVKGRVLAATHAHPQFAGEPRLRCVGEPSRATHRVSLDGMQRQCVVHLHRREFQSRLHLVERLFFSLIE